MNKFLESYDEFNKLNKKEGHLQNYMFFQNLKEIKQHIESLLSLNQMKIDNIISNGHDWAADHITTAKDDIEEVTSFLMNGQQISEDAYDEPVMPLKGSIKSSDYQAKEKIGYVSIISEEIHRYLNDGQQLEPAQIKLIDSIFDNISALKRQLQDREEVRQKEEEEMYKNINNPNL